LFLAEEYSAGTAANGNVEHVHCAKAADHYDIDESAKHRCDNI
jgi:hypothetical protein